MSQTPYQINRDLGQIIGRKPASGSEKIIDFKIDDRFITVLIEKSRTEKKGRKEITHSWRVLRVWERQMTEWALVRAVVGPQTDVEITLDFASPTRYEASARALATRLGRTYDRDGYRTPVAR